IRYSGSPIPLSFDELNTQKQVVLVEFTSQSTSPCISTLPVPRFQPMEVIKGDLQAIEKAINASEAIAQASKIDSINGADTDSNKSTVWLCIEVETQDYLSDLQQRVQQFLEGKNAEILQLKRVRQRTAKSLSETQNVQLSELSVKDVFEARLALASLDETPADTVTEAIEPQSKSTPLSRIDRIRHLFSDAVELVHTNKEDLANKEETEPLSTLSGSASASEQNQATQGEA
ncbi:MAG TPA: exonuclease subunit SbcD, partial [Alteromonas australica]|nr:exonuclease subunit SbcD [Alteromonas australica]